MSCTNNLKQLALAVHNHHDVYKMFPPSSHNTNFQRYFQPNSTTDWGWYRIGYITPLLSFMEQQPLYDEVLMYTLEDRRPWSGENTAAGQPSPYYKNVESLLCPSDPNKDLPFDWCKATSYHCNHGDIIMNWDWWEWRGSFGNGERSKCTFGTLSDGSSNTIMLAECPIGRTGGTLCPVKGGIATNVGWNQGSNAVDCLNRVDPVNPMMLIDPCQDSNGASGWGVGRRWGDAVSIYTVFFTIIGPNGPTCSGGGGEDWGIPTAGSHHPSGCNVALCDGSVRFITDTIDTGDPNQIPPDMGGAPQTYTGPSLWGVWGALGTTRGGEPLAEF
jgi:prepilin-type processing-associated H-X9-DG protein